MNKMQGRCKTHLKISQTTRTPLNTKERVEIIPWYSIKILGHCLEYSYKNKKQYKGVLQ